MKKKIVFMGTPEFSVQTLEVLNKSTYVIECVYTQPPKKSSRGQKIKASPIQNISEKLGLKVRTPTTLENKDEYEYLKSLKPYIVIVVAYGKIIPKDYLSLPKKGFLNIHASLLPKWRGAAPIQRAIINQDQETGISFMKINEGLDEGPYMKQVKVKINDKTTSDDLSKKLSKIGSENILECLDLIEKNKAKFIDQVDKNAIYAKKINKTEAKIDWDQSAKNIVYKINALNPYPGAWFTINKSRYKIWKAEISELNGLPGEILSEDLIIGCKEKSIKVIEIQKEGKKRLSVPNFIAGTKILKGAKVSK
ncbi:MAG: methionyl-tRNA formyltransferase [Pelagibacteraceae bacterium]